MDSGRFGSFVTIYNNLAKLSSGRGDARPRDADILTHLPTSSVSSRRWSIAIPKFSHAHVLSYHDSGKVP